MSLPGIGIILTIDNRPLFQDRDLLSLVYTLRQRQNGRHFPANVFKCNFLNENAWISIENSLKFVPKGPINNIPAVVQIMAWCQPGDKPLSESMMVSLLTQICITGPKWVNRAKGTVKKVAFWWLYGRCWWLLVFGTIKPWLESVISPDKDTIFSEKSF